MDSSRILVTLGWLILNASFRISGLFCWETLFSLLCARRSSEFFADMHAAGWFPWILRHARCLHSGFLATSYHENGSKFRQESGLKKAWPAFQLYLAPDRLPMAHGGSISMISRPPMFTGCSKVSSSPPRVHAFLCTSLESFTMWVSDD